MMLIIVKMILGWLGADPNEWFLVLICAICLRNRTAVKSLGHITNLLAMNNLLRIDLNVISPRAGLPYHTQLISCRALGIYLRPYHMGLHHLILSIL